MLRTRILTAAILAPLIVLVAWLGEPWLSLLVGLVVFLALAELIGLLDAAGYQPPQVVLMAIGLAVAGATLIAANQDSVGELLSGLLSATVIPGLPVVAYVAAVLVLAVAAFTRPDPRAGFLTWATSSFGVAYISLLLPFVALVGHLGPADGSAATRGGRTVAEGRHGLADHAAAAGLGLRHRRLPDRPLAGAAAADRSRQPVEDDRGPGRRTGGRHHRGRHRHLAGWAGPVACRW